MSNTGKHRPPPVGGHVFSRIDRHRALHFGGNTKNGRSDLTYIFDLVKKVRFNDLSYLSFVYIGVREGGGLGWRKW